MLTVNESGSADSMPTAWGNLLLSEYSSFGTEIRARLEGPATDRVAKRWFMVCAETPVDAHIWLPQPGGAREGTSRAVTVLCMACWHPSAHAPAILVWTLQAPSQEALVQEALRRCERAVGESIERYVQSAQWQRL